MEFNHLDITQKYPNASEPLRKPKHFKEMIGLAKKLSNGFPHVRVDFYEVDSKVYFGELTFFSMSGLTPFASAAVSTNKFPRQKRALGPAFLSKKT